MAMLGDWVMEIATVADESGQNPLEIVHRTITGPAPPVCWNMAFGVVAFGRKFPVPPPTTLQPPVPVIGVLPPNPDVMPPVQIICGPPTVAVVDAGEMVIVTSAVESGVQGELEIVHRTMIGPVPPVCMKVAFGVALFGLNVPVPPLTTLQFPVPLTGIFPPSPVVVPFPQMVCGPPTVAVVGGGVIVMVVVADESAQIPLEIVHCTVIGPVPPVWVKVALGLVALLKVPVPPLTTLHCPVPFDGVFPPRLAVVPLTQIVCELPTVAVVGGWLIVIVTVADEAVQGELEIVHCTITGPAPPV